MAKLIAKASLKSLIDKATKDDHIPTPGFLFNEINSKRNIFQKFHILLSHQLEQSFVSVENCQILQDLLIKRLQVDSPDVKLKSLRVIKQLIMKGHRSFRSELQRRTNELQTCLG